MLLKLIIIKVDVNNNSVSIQYLQTSGCIFVAELFNKKT